MKYNNPVYFQSYHFSLNIVFKFAFLFYKALICYYYYHYHYVLHCLKHKFGLEVYTVLSLLYTFLLL